MTLTAALIIRRGATLAKRHRNRKHAEAHSVKTRATVQSHVHLCQTLFRGMAENRTLLPWLEERIWPLEAAHTPETLAVSVIMSLREIISSGSTGLLDMGSVENADITVEILRESGIRAIACNALMDRGPSYLAKPLSWLQRETEKVKGRCGGLVSYGYAPRFVLSCSGELWDWLRYTDTEAVRTTHAAEAPGEMAHRWIAESGGNIHLLDSLGFLSGRTCLAHCVHLQPGELQVLAETGTAVVHCPWTNLKLGSGIANVPELLKMGITVMLGSDGAPCNNRLDLNGELRLASSLASIKECPGAISSRKWSRISGIDAAEFFGFSGFEEDYVEIGMAESELEELELAEDTSGFLGDLPRACRVRKVVCNGKVLYDNGHFPTLPPLPCTVGEARAIVWKRALSMGMNP
jgi:5-methylthioadenosine/S-adenosylhomocysteine deaminase